jgi:hypothetical protein
MLSSREIEERVWSRVCRRLYLQALNELFSQFDVQIGDDPFDLSRRRIDHPDSKDISFQVIEQAEEEIDAD